MNWHAHVGINTVPVRLAAQHKIPLVIWGEYGIGFVRPVLDE